MGEMDLYEQIIRTVDANIMFCIFPCILTLMLIGRLFKNRFKPKKALNLIRWFVIIYSIVTLSHFIFGLLFSDEETAIMNRATGPYWWAYWFMFICSVVLPYTLLIKKLASKYLYVLFVAIFIKIGFYFERFVIIVTSLHRDYSPNQDTSDWPDFVMYVAIVIFLQGFVLALLLLGIVELIDRSKGLYKKSLDKPNA
jgi:hypothetical protein